MLEAICSVPLPRGAGLTTRCAIELRLTDINPHAADLPPHQSPPDSRPFWFASISTSLDPTPVPLEGPQQLENAIAERASLLTDPKENDGFSKERVIVQIAASDSPNLTIIDLPGIIRTKTFG